MSLLSDEVLMTEVMSGKTMALAILVERYHAPLLGYLYRLVSGDQPLAEDLVQETFLCILQQRGYQVGRPFKPWLYTIATNLARDHFKSAAVRCVIRRIDDEDDVQYRSDAACSPEALMLASEQGYEILAMLRRLSEEYRVVLLLPFYQGMRLQEIADTLQVPLGTVKSRLSVGTRQLRIWYKTWEPTNVGMSAVLIVPYQSGIDRILTAMPSDQPTLADSQHTIYALQVLEQKAPDVLPWLVPHLVWVGIGLALVLFAALTFKRFRNVLN